MKRIASFIAIAALALVALSLMSCQPPVNVDDTGETVEGTYVWSVDIGISMESSYTFDRKTVTNRYNNGLDYVEDTYEYVIGIKDGVKVIKLTNVDTGARYEYEFDYGTGYVMIQGERYEVRE